MDLLASIPLDFIIQLVFESESYVFQLLSMLKLVRVLRLSKIITYLNLKDDIKMSLKLIKLMFFLLIYLHIFGCLWYLIVQ